jgi:hypothetical protein
MGGTQYQNITFSILKTLTPVSFLKSLRPGTWLSRLTFYIHLHLI